MTNVNYFLNVCYEEFWGMGPHSIRNMEMDN